jgi:hypothetical protein
MNASPERRQSTPGGTRTHDTRTQARTHYNYNYTQLSPTNLNCHYTHLSNICDAGFTPLRFLWCGRASGAPNTHLAAARTFPCLSHPALRNQILGEAFRRPANGGSTRHAPAPRAGNCGGCPWGLSSRSCTGGAAVSCRDPGPRSTTRCRGAGRPVRPCRKPRTS